MWKLAICSPSTSSGETSATNRHARPPAHAAARHAAGGARAALAPARPPAQAVDRRRSRPGRSGRRARRSTKCRETRHTIVTFACCSVARAARWSPRALIDPVGPRARPRAARRGGSAGATFVCRLPRAAAGRAGVRRLPPPAALAARPPLPALRAPSPPRGLPGGGRRVRPRVGAAGLRGAGARPRPRPEVRRRAARRGPDGRAPGRQPAARPAHRAGRPRSVRRWCGVPSAPRAGSGAGGSTPPPSSRPALAARAGLPLAPCLRRDGPGAAAGRGGAEHAAERRAVRGRRHRAAAARGGARRRRPHHRRDARRLRPRAEGGRCGVGGGRSPM